MQTALTAIALIAALLVLARLFDMAQRWLRRAKILISLAFAAVPACLAALPMVLQPGDVPRAWQPWSPLDLTVAPNPVSRMKVRALGVDGDLCRAAMGRSPARATLLPDAEDSESCHIRDRVRLSGLSTARLSPVETRCEIAARLLLWEKHVLQPAARRLLGAEIAQIQHFSSYSCRRMQTARGPSSRWSQHATANAIDISGFVLSDGRRLSLVRDWSGTGPEAVFLRAARDGLCDWFNIVLSPDYNRLHADHFHADMGPFLTCR